MPKSPPFVGRRQELQRFDELLRSESGQAILVVGPRGMGKTLLVNRMARCARDHPDLQCGAVRYEVTPADTVDVTMSLMMDNAFDAAGIKEKSFDADLSPCPRIGPGQALGISWDVATLCLSRMLIGFRRLPGWSGEHARHPAAFDDPFRRGEGIRWLTT